MGDNFQSDFAHGAYLVWDGGTLKFDIVEDETVDRDADITEHPVETGANVTDHYRVRTNAVKIEAFISQEPLDPSIYPDGQGSMQGMTLQLPSYPKQQPAVFGPTPSQPLPNAAAFAAALFIGNPLAFKQLIPQGNDPVPFVPNASPPQPSLTASFQALQFANPIDTLAIVLGVLEQLRQNATLVDVATRSWYYPQMLLGKITTKRNKDTGTGTIITLELKQVRFVSTQKVAAPPLPAKPKDKPNANKGAQQQIDLDIQKAEELVQHQSVLSALTGGQTKTGDLEKRIAEAKFLRDHMR